MTCWCSKRIHNAARNAEASSSAPKQIHHTVHVILPLCALCGTLVIMKIAENLFFHTSESRNGNGSFKPFGSGRSASLISRIILLILNDAVSLKMESERNRVERSRGLSWLGSVLAIPIGNHNSTTFSSLYRKKKMVVMLQNGLQHNNVSDNNVSDLSDLKRVSTCGFKAPWCTPNPIGGPNKPQAHTFDQNLPNSKQRPKFSKTFCSTENGQKRTNYSSQRL